MLQSEINKHKKNIPEGEKHLVHISIDRSSYVRGKMKKENFELQRDSVQQIGNMLKQMRSVEKYNVDGKAMDKSKNFLTVEKGKPLFDLKKTIANNDWITLLHYPKSKAEQAKEEAKKKAEQAKLDTENKK